MDKKIMADESSEDGEDGSVALSDGGEKSGLAPRRRRRV